jgi:hypothetical protein
MIVSPKFSIKFSPIHLVVALDHMFVALSRDQRDAAATGHLSAEVRSSRW